MGGCLSFASSDVLLSTDPVSDAIASAALGNTSYTCITYFIRVRDMVGLLGPGVKGVNHSKLRSCTPIHLLTLYSQTDISQDGIVVSICYLMFGGLYQHP